MSCSSILFRKCRKYSPSEPAKLNEKPLTKRLLHDFEPRRVIQAVQDHCSGHQSFNRTDLFDQYLEVSFKVMT